MSHHIESTTGLDDYSPAEAILNLTSHEVLRLSYSQNIRPTEMQLVEIYIWVCPKTKFFRGINVIGKHCVQPMSETPLSRKELLKIIDATAFQPGSDPIEKLPDMSVDDLQRLYHLNQVAA